MKENKSKRYWQNRKKKKMQALAPKSTGIMGFFKKIIDFFTPKSKSNTTSVNRSTKAYTKKEQVTGAKKIYTPEERAKYKEENAKKREVKKQKLLAVAEQTVSPEKPEKPKNIQKLVEKKEKTPEISSAKKRNILLGKVDFTRTGSAYIIVEDQEKDIFVSNHDTGTALPGDLVEVIVLANGRGRIVSVVERKIKKWSCTLELSEKFAFAVPNDIKMPYHIFVPLSETMDAKNGDRVIVEITEFFPRAKNPQGKIVQILGITGEHSTEMNSIIQEFNLPLEFSPEVLEASEAIDTHISEIEIAKRRDFRKILTLTIDPVDAKDFDDALSFQKLNNGNIEVGVHIADVSHYVVPHSVLDTEAYNRGNSIYLVDRVIPMLPEKLSNELCSLRPLEEKYCFSAVFQLTPEGEKVNQWLGRTVIYSQKRFAYEDAQAIIDGDVIDEEFGEAVLTLNHLAKNIRKQRMKDGALEITSREIKFILDEEHKPTGIYQKISKEANFLIEEFMLLANKTVAEVVGDAEHKKQPFPLIYRIHDTPKEEKIQEFKTFVARFGYKISLSRTTIKQELNDLIDKISGTPEETLISTMMIRTMAKAVYSTKNIGHYGLNFSYYAHFTSPIRRYADLLVHRSLQAFLDKKQYLSEDALEKMSKHISDTEKKASDAERESIKFKQVEWMQQHIGETFDGLISGLTDWGMYVEIVDYHCEGMISLKNISSDIYTFNAKEFCIEAQNSKTRLFFGDKVKVKVLGVNILKRTIDFQLVIDQQGFISEKESLNPQDSFSRETENFSDTANEEGQFL